jgi:hypothetical protein
MALLNDDQKLIQETARNFLAEEGSIAKQLRHWRDIGCSDGFGHGLWKQFAELGLTGICIPESAGGAGMGAVEAGLVLEEIGRNLTPSPFPDHLGRCSAALEGSAAERSAVSPASSRAKPSRHCRSTKAKSPKSKGNLRIRRRDRQRLALEWPESSSSCRGSRPTSPFLSPRELRARLARTGRRYPVRRREGREWA